MTTLNERDIETIVDRSLSCLGYVDNIQDNNRNIYKQQPKTTKQKKLLNKNRPDYIIYEKNTDVILAIIEVKRPNKNLDNAIEQAKKYAEILSCKIVIVTDGYYLKSLNTIDNEPLFINNVEITELPHYEELLKYQHTINIISNGKKQSKQALINLYKEANNILKNEGFSAGIDRFSQFANLMFYKIILEQKNNLLSKNWNNIINSDNDNLLEAVKNDLKKLFGHYSNVVTNTKIKSKKNLRNILSILDKINFTLTKTDYKGDAFEYFIHSYTKGTNNDLGQYFTPRHIVKLCVYLLNINKDDKIYDPFCGTGGMLIESFKYLRNLISDKSLQDIDILKNETFYGNEISDSYNIAKMNMICAGDGHNNISQKDTYKNKINNQYNKVITNIPFSQNTDYYSEYAPFINNSKNGDIVGILHCLYAMKKNDINSCSVIIIPISILYKMDDSTIALRKFIFDNYQLDLVVDLHEHTFQPYTMQHTAILKIKNKIQNEFNETNQYFKYFKLNNDGFSKNTYRIPIKENDIDNVLNDKNYEKIYTNDEWKNNGYKFKKLNTKIYNDYKLLHELCIIKKGINLSPNKEPIHFSYEYNKNTLPFYMAEDLSRYHINYSLLESRQYLQEQYINKKNIIPKHSILIVTSGQSSLKNHRAITEKESIISSTIIAFILKKNATIDFKYLFTFFLNFNFKDITYDYGYPGTTLDILENIKIPLKDEKIIKQVKYFDDLKKIEIQKRNLLKKLKLN